MKILAVIGLVAISTSVMAQKRPVASKVIYGDDDRLDVYEVNDPAIVALASSTAAMIPNSAISGLSGGTTTGGGGGGGRTGGWNSRSATPRANKNMTITGSTLQARGMCADERFANQLTAARCSGFLVAPNILVTAGHCMDSSSDCADNKWVFDYKVSSSAAAGSLPTTADNVYACKRVIKQVLNSSNQDDYAVVELDRPVVGRTPLKFRKSGQITVGTPVLVIGHPSGLPTKVADGANVRSLNGTHFVANLDTYGGNSGSAVFNAVTHEVEGILVRGETDYVGTTRGCNSSNRLGNTAGRGEDVTFITNIAEIKRLR